MILRHLAIRHGRRAAVASGSRRGLRFVSMTPQPAEAESDPPPAPTDAVRAPMLTSAVPNVTAETRDKQRIAAAEKVAIRRKPLEYYKYARIKSQTNHLGFENPTRYDPSQLYHGDGIPEQPTLELLMASQAHMGHHTSLWNPHNSRYIYGVRAGIHIISLETTLAHLRRAALVVEQVALYGGLILFVGTRRGQMPIVVSAAERAGACHLFSKWTPGTITNRDAILGGMPTKVVDERDEVLDGFDSFLLDSRPLMPDLVVCLNPLENYTMLHECGLANIPTIGIIDTDADPSWVTYQIPANDDSLRAVAVIANILGRAGGRGQAKRKELATLGESTWENSADVERFIEKTAREKLMEKKALKESVRVKDEIKAGIEAEAEEEAGGQVEDEDGELKDMDFWGRSKDTSDQQEMDEEDRDGDSDEDSKA